MSSYFKSLYKYFIGSSSDAEEENDFDQENFLAQNLLELELSDDKGNYQDNEPDPELSDAACFRRTGTITFIGESYVMIDGSLYLELNPGTFLTNDIVSYLCYKKEDDSLKVVRILENLGPAWGEHETEEEKFEVIEHVVIGEVDNKQERLIYIKNNDLKFSLDEVEATFVPLKGDWLELKCSVQWDGKSPSDVSLTQVLNVLSMKALRMKTKSSTITYWDGETGVCDNQIFFTKQFVQNGTNPKVGSKVLLKAIESNQGAYGWRAVMVIPDDSFKIVEKNTAEQETEEDKSFQVEIEHNINVTHPLKFEKVSLQQNNETIVLNIENNSNQSYSILKWKLMSRRSDSQLLIKPVIMTKPYTLFQNKILKMTITCKPKFLGNSKELLVIVFKGFELKRFVTINVTDDDTQSYNNYTSNNTSNYYCNQSNLKKNMSNILRNGDRNIVPGVRLVKPPNFIPTRLGMFPIPNKIWNIILGDSDQPSNTNEFNSIMNSIGYQLPCLLSELNIHNYTDKWHTLVYMEEIQQNIHIRVYDMPKVFLDRCQEFLSLEIKGLSERRPSLLQGDRVVVKNIWDQREQEYEGYIHELRGNLILLKFHPRFHESYNGSDVSVVFHFGRTVFRRAHQAINLAISNLGPELLFPSRVVSTKPQVESDKLQNFTLFNKNLNAGQTSAVMNILEGRSRPMPYVIYGPPGTGKTVTVIETILQILHFLPGSRILVATPSNSASNLITERLIQYRHVFSDSIIRLIANHLLNSENIPEKIKPFCATLDITKENTSKDRYRKQEDGINLNCQTSFVGRHRVTIGTCTCLGSLALIGLPRGHFTHIIIDEACQATEPEIMIPMTFTDKDNGQIILAGDPMQLGPVILSKYCKEFGMDVSYLSRLLERFPYQKDYDSYKKGYDPRLVTKLVDNYRSLEEVLTLPSQMFYDGKLVPRINRNEEWVGILLNVVSDIFCNDHTTGGIYVYGIRGLNARAEDSPSWFNPQEASMVAITTCKLYKNGVTPDDIGIITPYIAQIKQLRLIFDAMGLPQPKIGSVEEFQGQERPIILISTVRSTESYLQDDQKHTLGFVQNAKRMNVALTRAQLAVLLFCNPHLLCKDNLWKNVIFHSVQASKYMGCDLPAEISSLQDN